MDWKEIKAQAKSDLEQIQTDQDAIAFIERYFAADLRADYMDASELRPQEATKRVGHFCSSPSGCEATSTRAESSSNR